MNTLCAARLQVFGRSGACTTVHGNGGSNQSQGHLAAASVATLFVW